MGQTRIPDRPREDDPALGHTSADVIMMTVVRNTSSQGTNTGKAAAKERKREDDTASIRAQVAIQKPKLQNTCRRL